MNTLNYQDYLLFAKRYNNIVYSYVVNDLYSYLNKTYTDKDLQKRIDDANKLLRYDSFDKFYKIIIQIIEHIFDYIITRYYTIDPEMNKTKDCANEIIRKFKVHFNVG